MDNPVETEFIYSSGIDNTGDLKGTLTDLEKDALGESVNISMGSATKALSTILNMKVMITIPEVEITQSKDFEYKNMFPAIGVTIRYIDGLSGLNFFVLKQTDVKKIVNIMMGMPDSDDDSKLNELYISGISEVMNQMMGASSTSLATFFNRKINISTPDCIEIKENDNAHEVLGLQGNIIVIKLNLMIGTIINSQIISIMPVEFAKELAENLINEQLSNQDAQQSPPPPKPPQTRIAENSQNSKKMRSGRMEVNNNNTDKENVNVMQPDFTNFDEESNTNVQAGSNLDLIMDVPIDVVVQIGKIMKPVKDIVKLTQGSIIELDKQAGSPVDVMVNGELIARGDVVVIDDNFGVRITEIVKKNSVRY